MSDDRTLAAAAQRLLENPKLSKLLTSARKEMELLGRLERLGGMESTTEYLGVPSSPPPPPEAEEELTVDALAHSGPVEVEIEELRWVVASDEDGFALKTRVRKLLATLGADVSDLGPMLPAAVDYPDYAMAVGRALQVGAAERGILVCGHGVGAAVAANKMRGVRAGLCHDAESILDGVEKDDMNVLVLPAKLLEPYRVGELIKTFRAARFAGATHHRRCLEKIRNIEMLAAG